MHQVKLWWQSYHFHGSLSHVLACKLKSLKGDLRRRNDEIFGHVGKRKIGWNLGVGWYWGRTRHERGGREEKRRVF